MIGGKLVLNH